jgi:hypothetical protein
MESSLDMSTDIDQLPGPPTTSQPQPDIQPQLTLSPPQPQQMPQSPDFVPMQPNITAEIKKKDEPNAHYNKKLLYQLGSIVALYVLVTLPASKVQFQRLFGKYVNGPFMQNFITGIVLAALFYVISAYILPKFI